MSGLPAQIADGGTDNPLIDWLTDATTVLCARPLLAGCSIARSSEGSQPIAWPFCRTCRSMAAADRNCDMDMVDCRS